MRLAVFVALFLLSACASDKLALAPPAGVDLSGHWTLNVEDSDDPLHLLQSQSTDPSKVTSGSQGQGRSGRQGNRGGPPLSGGVEGPSVPALGALSEGLRWPGHELDIKQVAGVVAITSAGLNQVYQPSSGDGTPRPRQQPSGRPTGRDRDGLPARCGWEGRTLVVQVGESDDDQPPSEERYSLSADGQRLIEVVGFKGGRSRGFTMSRVWDRSVPGAAPMPQGVAPAQGCYYATDPKKCE